MKKKKYIIYLFLSVFTFTHAQTFSIKGYKRGDIQWQHAPDAINWKDIPGANQEHLSLVDTETELFYRACVAGGTCEEVCTHAYKTGEADLNPVSFEKVELTDRFWRNRMKTQKETLVPIAFERTEPSVENLRRTANFLRGIEDELPTASLFISSDLYKVMEGAAYLLKTEKDPMLEAQMDEIIKIIADAQQADGYHYEGHITGVAAQNKDMGETPYSFIDFSHELYNMGHLYEAAVAYYQATGKRNLLAVAEKNAKHINKVFFEGDPNYNNGQPVNRAPGHQEIELALIKLYRVTNNSLYLEMAKKFIDIRGVTHKTTDYAQQHLPVRDQREASGHAVRATYMYSGMADVSTLTNDKTLRPALLSIWEDIVNTRMHITGGLGAIAGTEGFGPQYLLPNANTYNETCAAVGNVFFNQRMFLVEKDGKYMDVAEISLFNNVLAGVNFDGDKFFYVNPLEWDGVKAFNHGVNGRASWFGTACCPTNLARLIPQVSGMMYAYTDNEIYCSFYAGSQVSIPLTEGSVEIKQTTDYPFDETVSILVKPQREKQFFTLKMRIPSWAQSTGFVPSDLYTFIDNIQPQWQVTLNGKIIETVPEKGFISISREWSTNDLIKLTLPMPIRYVHASDKVSADRGRVAITRGPLLYCTEGVDNEENIFSFYIDDTSGGTTTHIDSGILSGIDQITIPAHSVSKEGIQDLALTMIPYYAWNNRGTSPMLVWIPESETLARNNCYIEPEFIKELKASFTYQGDGNETPADDVKAIIDGKIPNSSSDNSIPRWTSWSPIQVGKDQWIEFTFEYPVNIGMVAVYWYADGRGVDVPKSWNLEYMENGNWMSFPLAANNKYDTDKDKFNDVIPQETIWAEALRINMKPLNNNVAVGILEMTITETGLIQSVTASHTWEGDDVNAIIDKKYPNSSSDTEIPRWTSWPQIGKSQWIEFTLVQETNINTFSVY